LAGANGIGKSTFLAAVNFAITGRIPDPNRGYSTAEGYYLDSARFTHDFFDGRVDQVDRSAATISVEIAVGTLTFHVTRGLFDVEGLRVLKVTDLHAKKERTLYDGTSDSALDRHNEYTTRITQAIGLKSFEQFVFIQHFVLTFDESRKLLFWDEKGLEAALFLAFGQDPDQQQIAEHYRHEMERLDSNARNTRWQARRTQKRMEEIRAALEPQERTEDFAQLEGRYQSLMKRHDRAIASVERAELKAGDAGLKFAEASAAHAALRSEYAKAFAEHVGDASMATQHPIVLEATSEDCRCRICGTEGREVAAAVTRKISKHGCPFCDSPLTASRDTKEQFEILAKLDQQLAIARTKLERAVAVRDRIEGLLTDERARVATIISEIEAFEDEHAAVAKWVRGKQAVEDSGLGGELARLDKQMRELLVQSRAEYDDRNRWKAKLQKMQRELHSRYQQTEEEFVPMFRELAELFIGIELDVSVEARPNAPTSLVLEMRSTARREQHQLSESQRFFLDIALRMALARFASDSSAPATLLIDTPEGSLDIAYEARAGQMFAEFVKGGHDIVMTANVNTSQMLKKLARSSGTSRMKLVRMTEWSELSEVQIEEEDLFREAYSEIEAALREGDTGANANALSTIGERVIRPTSSKKGSKSRAS
jgi:DNA repair exonuclease SbcCD ATPase subunit